LAIFFQENKFDTWGQVKDLPKNRIFVYQIFKNICKSKTLTIYSLKFSYFKQE
jgi:hypothetical protein